MGPDCRVAYFTWPSGSDYPADRETSTTKEERDPWRAASSGIQTGEDSVPGCCYNRCLHDSADNCSAGWCMFMLGNLFRESGVVKQLTETASNALMYIVVIFLGTSVGATTSAEAFLNLDTIKIVVLAPDWHSLWHRSRCYLR